MLRARGLNCNAESPVNCTRNSPKGACPRPEVLNSSPRLAIGVRSSASASATANHPGFGSKTIRVLELSPRRNRVTGFTDLSASSATPGGAAVHRQQLDSQTKATMPKVIHRIDQRDLEPAVDGLEVELERMSS